MRLQRGAGRYEHPPSQAFPDLPGQCWSLDFLSGVFGHGRPFRILAVFDDFSRRVCLVLSADTSLHGQRVARELDALVRRYGQMEIIVSVNGTELTSRAILNWQTRTGVASHDIEPDKPVQNAFIGSFNRRLRDELPTEEFFDTLPDAKQHLARWRHDYHTRPHSSLGALAPAARQALTQSEARANPHRKAMLSIIKTPLMTESAKA